MGLLLILVLSLLSSGVFTDVNILPNKVIYTSENSQYSSKLNDNDTYSRYISFSSSKVKWAVFDLGDVYKLSTIVLWNRNYPGLRPVNFYVGNEFSPCKFHKQISNYKACQLNVIQKNPSTTFTCDTTGNTGRYFAMVKGDFSSILNLETLYVFELQAFGVKVSSQSVPTRPTIVDSSLPPISADAFHISKAILKGVTSVTFPQYSSQMVYLNSNCQPIIWDPSSLMIFSVACQSADGKGRLAVFGKNAYFTNILTTASMQTLKSNLLQWLSPSSLNSTVVSTISMKTVSDLKRLVKPGNVIMFYTWNVYPDDLVTEIINLCLNGTNSLTLDHTYWVAVSNEVTSQIVKVLGAFNVGFPTTIINWNSATQMTLTSDSFVETLLGLPFMLERMATNHQYFLTNGNSAAGQLLQIPSAIIARSDVASSLKKIIAKYDTLMDWICPCEMAPAINVDDRALINIYSQLLRSQALVNSGYKMPCIDLFPGDFETPPATTTTTITVNSQTANTNNPIGYYLPAGATLQYSIQKSVGLWTISVGCHSDVLTDNRPGWSRYPYVFSGYIDLNQRGQIYSPFGGVLWLGNADVNQTITITLSNIVATPFFNGRVPSAIDSWANQVKNPGLWSQVMGQTSVICGLSSYVRIYDGNYLMDLMTNNWDNVIKMDYAINGKDWTIQRPTMIVLDIMTSMGAAHSGYPIVTWDDWYSSVYNKTQISQSGSWGMCHEIGHNMQDSRWQYTGLTEVTNNLLCLYNYDKFWKVRRYGNDIASLDSNAASITTYLNNGAIYADYRSNPWIALAIYSQMAKYMGWGFFKNVFKYYNDNKLDPRDNDAKITTWIKATSIVSGQNLLPLFDFWGIPISTDAREVAGKLPCFFPDDFLTQMSASQTNKVLTNYPNCARVSGYYLDYDPINEIKGSLPNFITFS